MNKKYFIVAILLLLGQGFDTWLKSQSRQANCVESIIIDSNPSSHIAAQIYTNAYPSYTNQFYNNWQQADVYFTNGKTVKGLQIRYNGYEDEMLWKRQSDKKVGSLIKSTVSKVLFYPEEGNEQLFRNMNIKLPMSINPTNVYLKVLVEGELSLYCYHKVKLVKNTPELFYDSFQYFVEKDQKLLPITLNRSDILGLFTSRDEMKAFRQFMRENDWRFRKEKDITKAFKQYNQIH